MRYTIITSAILTACMLSACGASPTVEVRATTSATDSPTSTATATSSPSTTPTTTIEMLPIPLLSEPLAYTGELPDHVYRQLGVGRIDDTKLSPNGKQVAVMGSTGLYVYAVESQELLWYNQKYFARIEWSPDGGQLAAGDIDGVVHIYNSNDGKRIYRLEGISIESLSTPKAILSMTWSSDGTRLASATRTGVLTIWDMRSGQALQTLVPGGFDVRQFQLGTNYVIVSIAFSPDADRLIFENIGSGHGSIFDYLPYELWDIASGERIAELDTRYPAAWSPDGTQIAYYDETLGLTIMDSFRGETTTGFTPNTRIIHNVHWLSNTQVLSWDFDKQAMIWNTETDTVVDQFPFDLGQDLLESTNSYPIPGFPEMWWSPDNSIVVISIYNYTTTNYTTTINDVVNKRTLSTLHDTIAIDVAWSGNQPRLITRQENRYVDRTGAAIEDLKWRSYLSYYAISDELQGEEIFTFDQVSPIVDMEWSPDGSMLATRENGRFNCCTAVSHIWDREGNWLHTIRSAAVSTGLDWTSDQQLFAFNGKAQVYRDYRFFTIDLTVDRRINSSMEIYDNRILGIKSLQFSPDGTKLATVAEKVARYSLILWDYESEQVICDIAGTPEGSFDMDWSPNGKRIVVRAYHQDREANISRFISTGIYDAETCELVHELPSYDSVWYYFGSVAWSGDGRIIAISAPSQDDLDDYNKPLRGIILWDTATGEQLEVLELWRFLPSREELNIQDHLTVRSLDISPDGRYLAVSYTTHEFDNTYFPDRAPSMVIVWDIQNQELVQVYQDFNTTVASVAFSPDGTLLAAGSLDGTIRLYEMD